ncbi:MAG: cardiolipin synthase [Nocardioides sp.]|nr:cardiolipin synthase [Nocardioides sp.]
MDNFWLWVAALLSSAWVIAGIALRVAALGIIPGNRKPSTGMAWLLVILFAPLVGLIAFAFFGSSRLGRRRHDRQERAHRAIAERSGGHPDRVEVAGHLGSIVALNEKLGSMPLTGGNHAELIEDYAGSIEAMIAAIGTAEQFVHVEFYITALDEVTRPFFDALDAATSRGVHVKLLFDHLGSRAIPGYDELVERLEASSIDFRAMLPLQLFKGRYRRPDLRNHRKLVVVDGHLGFMGSQNLTEPSYNKAKNRKRGRTWVELMVRLRGPVVAELDAVFAADWYTESDELLTVTPPSPPEHAEGAESAGLACQLVPSGPGLVAENNLRLFGALIHAAQRRVSLTSPYFVPDESLLYAVTTAAHRGLEVELFVSEVSDQFMVGHAQNSFYRALLEAGVRIHRYPAPYVLHAKHFTIDDSVAVIGSSNMDMRSFALNYEISLMLLGPGIVGQMRAVEDHYRELSSELTLEEWARRSAPAKYVDNVMRLTSALQ